jgi:hypothetical protein
MLLLEWNPNNWEGEHWSRFLSIIRLGVCSPG